MMCQYSKKIYFILVLLLVAQRSVTQQTTQIWPLPQEMQFTGERFIPAALYRVAGTITPPAEALSLLKEIVAVGEEATGPAVELLPLRDTIAPLRRSGAYRLLLSPGKITVEAVDRRSVFYAIQTLRQLVQSDSQGRVTLPTGIVTDYPDVAYRGTVEGFYGQPWSHQDRLEQLRFYGKLKLNTYIYGPKDDPYHSSPHWRVPYPAEKADQLKELVGEAQRNGVDFVWAIHPGGDIRWNRADSQAVLRKLEHMYDLGVRSFAVFFDDIAGAGTDAHRQAGLLNFLQQHFVAGKKDVTPLIMCPTEYNRAWSNQKEGSYLDILGKELHPSIEVMWTGNTVVADITTEGFQWVGRRLRRPAFAWWNFPVSDYVRDHLLLGPAYGLDTTAAPYLSGFVANPMDKAEASKLAIFSVAGYSWNMKKYDPEAAWSAAVRAVLPSAPQALELFAAHNSDPGPNGHRYRRKESVEIQPVVDSFLRAYKKGSYLPTLAAQLEAEFDRLLPVARQIREAGSNPRLVEQLAPWLGQFDWLARAGAASMAMLRYWDEGNPGAAWQQHLQLSAFLDSMEWVDGTLNQNPYQPGVKTGSLVLMPMVRELYAQAGRYFEAGGRPQESPRQPSGAIMGSAVYTNSEKLRYQPLRARNGQLAVSPVLEAITLSAGEYVGLQWPPGLKPLALHVHLQHSSLQSWGRFEASTNGQQWTEFRIQEKNGKGVYRELDDQVHWIRFRNTGEKPQSLYLRELRLEIEPADTLRPSVFAVDGSVATCLTFSRNVSVQLPLVASSRPLALLLQSGGASYTITGVHRQGKKVLLYEGSSSFVRLPSSAIRRFTHLELSTGSDQSLRLCEVIPWQL